MSVLDPNHDAEPRGCLAFICEFAERPGCFGRAVQILLAIGFGVLALIFGGGDDN